MNRLIKRNRLSRHVEARPHTHKDGGEGTRNELHAEHLELDEEVRHDGAMTYRGRWGEGGGWGVAPLDGWTVA